MSACPACGKENEKGARFCVRCMSDLVRSETSQAIAGVLENADPEVVAVLVDAIVELAHTYPKVHANDIWAYMATEFPDTDYPREPRVLGGALAQAQAQVRLVASGVSVMTKKTYLRSGHPQPRAVWLSRSCPDSEQLPTLDEAIDDLSRLSASLTEGDWTVLSDIQGTITKLSLLKDEAYGRYAP